MEGLAGPGGESESGIAERASHKGIKVEYAEIMQKYCFKVAGSGDRLLTLAVFLHNRCSKDTANCVMVRFHSYETPNSVGPRTAKSGTYETYA